ncbi:hypothetical protein Asi03nite_28590 [Actinoplanes siamensis]|uniref:Phage integrase family protein n=1 Tax=Actinoplanes siamensis TaxID=1223317 RepID=A0A919N6K7_9ACTN|nr:hypothetical protein Asi03nite_28590 [Actinoplanes siamensis]
MSPQNVRRQWRQARAEAGLEWVKPHTFRKTVATLIGNEAEADRAAAQLGHGEKGDHQEALHQGARHRPGQIRHPGEVRWHSPETATPGRIGAAGQT